MEVISNEKVLISSGDDAIKYRNFILENNDRKIRALSIDLINKFFDCYNNYKEKEDLDRHYRYKYEIFGEFLNEIQFVFSYLKELLEYKMIEEAEYFLNRILKFTIDTNWEIVNEFIGQTTPYYLIMNSGALLLKYNYSSTIDNFFNINLKSGSSIYGPLMDSVSFYGEGWEFVTKEIIKKNYYAKRYSTISEHLLPKIITTKEYNIFDAYITMYIVLTPIFIPING